MAYTTPGVFIEETLPQRTPIIEAGTGVAAFFGFTKRGPAHKPVPVFSFAEFKRIFGGSINGESAEYAVQGFFDNGGSKAYFVRLSAYDTATGVESASAASLSLSLDGSTDTINIEAGFRGTVSPGEDANSLNVKVLLDSLHPSAGAGNDLTADASVADTEIKVSSTIGLSAGSIIKLSKTVSTVTTDELAVVVRVESVLNSGVLEHIIYLQDALVNDFLATDSTLISLEYSVTVQNAQGVALEQWNSLSVGYDSATNFDLTINDPDLGSEYIKSTTTITSSVGEIDLTDTALATGKALSGGQDEHSTFTSAMFLGSEAIGKGLNALNPITDASLLCVPPSITSTSWGIKADASFHAMMLEYAKSRANMFAILDAPSGKTPAEIKIYREVTLGANSHWGAMYYPHLTIQDPDRPQSRATLTIAPSGHVAGLYGRVDGLPAPQGGISATPAGVNNNGLLRGVLGLESLVSDKEQGTLNPIGVNCIRLLDQPTGGKAIFVFGGRTLSSDPNFRYVSVRRTLTYIEESVRLSSRFAVFQKNSPTLWSLLTQIITQFLSQEWQDGNLAGASTREAFFVEINQNTMTATDIENGILRGRIGVSLHRPAEFIIFTFSQTQSGSEIEES